MGHQDVLGVVGGLLVGREWAVRMGREDGVGGVDQGPQGRGVTMQEATGGENMFFENAAPV